MLTHTRLATLAVVTAIPLTIPTFALAQTSDTPTVTIAHGANNTSPNPYAPSGVGEGDNQGNGKAPENGTVGKADDKNPPGQSPGGSDGNKGYECDANKGVGNNGGNPAHSGCVSASPSVSPTPSKSPKPSHSPKPSKSPKASKSPKPTTSPTTKPTKPPFVGPVTPKPPFVGPVINPHSPVKPHIVPVAPKKSQVTPVELPRTGSSTPLLLAIGIGALASGAAMTIAGRKEV